MHIHWAYSNESTSGARDTDEDLSALRGVLAAAVRASELFDNRCAAASVVARVSVQAGAAPHANPEALKPADYQGPWVFGARPKPVVKAGGGLLGAAPMRSG